jgi:phage shock protein PspC (stress-responsive transcriptional regulator)
MQTMKNIFIRYQFELIFCVTLFLFLLFGISNVTFAAHSLEHTVSETTGKTGGSAGGSSGWFEWFGIDDKIKNLVFALATTIGMAVVWILTYL